MSRNDHFSCDERPQPVPRVAVNQVVDDNTEPVASRTLRQVFSGPIIAAGGFNAETAAAAVKRGDADLVAFGRDFLANPDLPHRLRHNLPLNAYNRDTFHGGDHRGYTDYPFAATEVTARMESRIIRRTDFSPLK